VTLKGTKRWWNVSQFHVVRSHFLVDSRESKFAKLSRPHSSGGRYIQVPPDTSAARSRTNLCFSFITEVDRAGSEDYHATNISPGVHIRISLVDLLERVLRRDEFV
jgi:hypothetical protein